MSKPFYKNNNKMINNPMVVHSMIGRVLESFIPYFLQITQSNKSPIYL